MPMKLGTAIKSTAADQPKDVDDEEVGAAEQALQTAAPTAPGVTSPSVAAAMAAKGMKNEAKAAPAAKKIVGEGQVSAENKAGLLMKQASEAVETPIEAPAPGTPMARVVFGLRRTINTGNYENMQPHVQIEIPCAANSMAYEETMQFAFDWVNEKMAEIAQGVVNGGEES